MTPEEMIAFETDIAETFNRGEIRAPVHLEGGNEAQIIEVFRDIKREDWVLGSWRMHYKCLLHGVPPERLKADILAGRSITLCYPQHRIISSAIVGGILPIALGIAWSLKRGGEQNRVHAFLGDMTAETGIACECIKYAFSHDLPIRFIIEDNGKSVCSDTRETWGRDFLWFDADDVADNVVHYRYSLGYPHAGAGRRVQF